ncbi:MAG: hypothetical protein PVF91_15170 [Chromatiales bacterium]|jgi:hypothetical protein
MTQSDKTREKLIASIRKAKAPDTRPETEARAPKAQGPAARARGRPAAARPKTARTRKPRTTDAPEQAPAAPASYALGGLRWPD